MRLCVLDKQTENLSMTSCGYLTSSMIPLILCKLCVNCWELNRLFWKMLTAQKPLSHLFQKGVTSSKKNRMHVSGSAENSIYWKPPKQGHLFTQDTSDDTNGVCTVYYLVLDKLQSHLVVRDFRVLWITTSVHHVPCLILWCAILGFYELPQVYMP